MESFGGVAPEVKGHVGVLHSSLRISLLTVDKVRELYWVFDEEDRGVIANHIVIALLSVEFYGEPARITVTIVSSTFTSHC